MVSIRTRSNFSCLGMGYLFLEQQNLAMSTLKGSADKNQGFFWTELTHTIRARNNLPHLPKNF